MPVTSAGPPRAAAARPSSPRRSRWPAAPNRCSSISTANCRRYSDCPSPADKASPTGWRPTPPRRQSLDLAIAVDRTTSLVPRGHGGRRLRVAAMARAPRMAGRPRPRRDRCRQEAAAQRARATRRPQPSRHARAAISALRRAVASAARPHGVVLVAEPGRSLRRRERRTVHRRPGRRHCERSIRPSLAPSTPGCSTPACRERCGANCEARHEPHDRRRQHGQLGRRRSRRGARVAPPSASPATRQPSSARTCAVSRRWRAPTPPKRSCAPPSPGWTGSANSTRCCDDPTIDEVLVNSGGEVWIERDGDLQPVGHLAADDLAVVVERILAPLGRRVDRSSPVVDARLPDGSRVCAVVPPVAVDGACLAVRRFHDRALPLLAFCDDAVARLLEELVARRCNVIVSGATSSGKTSLLNSTLALAPAGERLVIIEDTAELLPRVPSPRPTRSTPGDAGRPGRHHPRTPRADGPSAAAGSPRRRRGARARRSWPWCRRLNTGHDGVVVDMPRQQRARCAAPARDVDPRCRAGVAA